MAGEDKPPLEDWYTELIYPIDGEADTATKEAALYAVRIAMDGIAQAIAAGRITNVQISFEIPGEPRQGFTFSSPEED